MGHDTSVRQHYIIEYWAPYLNQTPSWYDWKVVESDVKTEQTTTKIFAEKIYNIFHVEIAIDKRLSAIDKRLSIANMR